MTKEYNPKSIEEAVQEKWESNKTFESKLMTGKSFIAFPCSHIHLVNYIWGMLEITPLVM